MTERPIIFSGPMVRAITRETDPKTQTRRPVTGMALTWLDQFLPEYVADPANHLSPYGHAGERLWVRETIGYRDGKVGQAIAYRATGELVGRIQGERGWESIHHGWITGLATHQREGKWYGAAIVPRWTPAIHMPRWACRLVLDVAAVRIERLQDCTEADAQAEGIDATTAGSYRAGYALLWDSLNAKRGYSWATNPWVWVIEFRRVNG